MLSQAEYGRTMLPHNNKIQRELLILAPLEVGAFKRLGGTRGLRVKPAIH